MASTSLPGVVSAQVAEFVSDAAGWKGSVRDEQAYALDSFFPGAGYPLGCLCEGPCSLPLAGGSVTIFTLSGGEPSPDCAVIDGSSSFATSDMHLVPGEDRRIVMEFEPAVTAFFAYYGSVAAGSAVSIDLFSQGALVDQFSRGSGGSDILAYGHGFNSAIPIDRLEFKLLGSDDAANIGAFVGLDPGESSLGTVEIPDYAGPTGSAVEFDFACAFVSQTQSDCNGNAVPDNQDIASGSSSDVDGNGIPDECEGSPIGEPRLEHASVEVGVVRGLRGAAVQFERVRGLRLASIEFDQFSEGRQIELLPGSLSFGAVPTGSSSAQSLMITNIGNGQLTVSDIVQSGDADFIVTAATTFPVVLGPGQSQVLSVAFGPLAVGDRSGDLEILSDDQDAASILVSLDGTGELGCTGPADCDDSNVCTDDACDPALGCVHSFNSAPCDDGSVCTAEDACLGGTCVGGPSVDCSDGLTCTVDSCDPVGGCSNVADACVDLDVKPGACPNHVNVRSNGKLTVALTAAPGFDIRLVTAGTLQMSRADGVGGSVAPQSVRVDDIASIQPAPPCVCHSLAGDGFNDLNLKFSVADLTEVLDLDALPTGESVEVVLSGFLHDGTPLTARDCIQRDP